MFFNISMLINNCAWQHKGLAFAYTRRENYMHDIAQIQGDIGVLFW